MVYYISLIDFLCPKYIFNFLDNSLLFSNVDLNLNRKNFITFQNGFRCELNFLNNNLFFSNICLFSHLDKQKYLKYNCKINNSYILGPIRALYYKDKNKVINESDYQYDICLVSQYPGIYNFNDENFIKKKIEYTISKMNEFLNRLKNEENKKISILMRGNSQDEINFYKNYGFEDSDLIERNHKNHWQTYDVINKSVLTLGFTTSCVQEAWSMGKKGIIIDFTNTKLFNFFDLNLTIRDEEYLIFSKKINYFISISLEEFKNKFAEEISMYSVDFRKKTLETIRNKIHA